MKKSIINLGFGILLFAGIVLFASFRATTPVSNNEISSAASAVVASPFKELLIQIDEINDKNFSDIRNAIEGGGGVVYKGYCSNLHTLMYLVNRDVHPDNSFLDKLSLMSVSYVVKEGTIAQVCAECNMEPIPTPDVTTETE